jgi:hypothetical protein
MEPNPWLFIPQIIPLSAYLIDKMNIAGLKKVLSIHTVQFSNSLKKTELKERLLPALEARILVTLSMNFSKKNGKAPMVSNTDMTGFAPGSYWLPLVSTAIPVL